jgi:hypothetical protein
LLRRVRRATNANQHGQTKNMKTLKDDYEMGTR